MYAMSQTKLDACLESIVSYVHRIQQLDPSVEAEREQALAASREVMGAVAMYRGLLKRAGQEVQWPLRYAA